MQPGNLLFNCLCIICFDRLLLVLLNSFDIWFLIGGLGLISTGNGFEGNAADLGNGGIGGIGGGCV